MTSPFSALFTLCVLILNMSIAPAQTGNKQAGESAPKATVKDTKAVKRPTCTLTNEDYAVFTAVLEGLGKPEDPEEAWQDRDILITDLTDAGEVEDSQWKGWGFRSNSKATPNRGCEFDG
ncbi:MAG: hypothetical protein LAO78_24465 [Acidobacteriia bacterium]|nr:hypothetical protein [Terriglobia bacterium]